VRAHYPVNWKWLAIDVLAMCRKTADDLMSFGQRITTNDGRERAVGRGDASRRVGINSCTANLMRPPSGVVAGVPAISRSICIRRFSARSAACSNQAERCSMSADFHSAQSAPISASFLSIYEFKSSGPRRVKAKHWLGSSEQSTPLFG
jgi:hypothetical protein